MDFDLLGQIDANLGQADIGIVEFCESPKYCGKHLYPKQRLFLKLVFLESLTDFEEQMLDSWIASDEITISPDIRERMQWCRDAGYKHFREIVLVGGRRSSKGFLTGAVLAKKMWDTLQLQDPNQHYGIDADKEIYFSCVAASEKQAKDMQYSDFATTANSCLAMAPYIKKVQELEFSVRTEADMRRSREWERQGRKVMRDTSTLRGRALPANSRTLRGYTSMAIVFDEFAHFMQGESDMSDDEVYESAIPSLAQFGQDGILFCNSSPYTKVGKFFERYEESLSVDNGKAVAPMMLGLRFPSWAMFEGWWDDPTYTGAPKCITVSPDWDPERLKGDGTHFYSKVDRQAIPVERNLERDNPEKFKVERRSNFSETIDAYLMPEFVDRMFAGIPTGQPGAFNPLKTNWNDSTYNHKYKCHLDPSSTTAGFGFAMGHIEEIDGPHVVFDIIKRWHPSDFPAGVIDWEAVLPEVLNYIDLFRPYEITFDQFNSAAPIQWLRRECRNKGIYETKIYEKTALAQSNWNRAEIFKTALYKNVVHAPRDTADADWASMELKYLQELRTGRIPRVEKQQAGPVQTKDMADCIMEVVEALIGNIIANETRDNIGGEPLRLGAPGGYPLGGPDRGGKGNSPLSQLYGKRTGEQSGGGTAMSRGKARRANPARRAGGGRPVPRRLPGW